MGRLETVTYSQRASTGYFAGMAFTRGESEQSQPNAGDFAWGWIGAAFVLTFSALVWGVVGEFLY